MVDSVLRSFIQGKPLKKDKESSQEDNLKAVRGVLKDISQRTKNTADLFKGVKTDNKGLLKLMKDLESAQQINAKLSASGKTINKSEAAKFLSLTKKIEAAIEKELDTQIDGKRLEDLIVENKKATLKNADVQKKLDKTSKKIGQPTEAFFKENVEKVSEAGLTKDTGLTGVNAISAEAGFVLQGLGVNVSELIGDTLNRLGEDEGSNLDDSISDFSEGLDEATKNLQKSTTDSKSNKLSESMDLEIDSLFVDSLFVDKIILPSLNNFTGGTDTVPQSPQLGSDNQARLGFDDNPQLGFDNVPQLGFDNVPQLGLDGPQRLGFDDTPKLGFDKGITVVAPELSDSMDSVSLAITDSLEALEGEFIEASMVAEDREEERHIETIEALDDIEESSGSKGFLGKTLGKIGKGLGSLFGTLGKGGLLGKAGGGVSSLLGKAKDVGGKIGKAGKFGVGALGLGALAKIATRGFENTEDFEPIKKSLIEFFNSSRSSVEDSLKEGARLFEIFGPTVAEDINTGIDEFYKIARGITTDAIEEGVQLFSDPVGFFADIFSPIGDFFVEMGNSISNFISEGIDSLEGTIADFIVNKGGFIGEKAVETLGLRTTQQIADSKNQPLDGNVSTISVDGALADGGPVFAGGDFLVGEDGPEIFSPTTGGEIIPLPSSGGESAASLESEIATANVNSVTESVRKETIETISRATSAATAASPSKGSTSSPRRSLGSSPLHTTDIGLLVVLGGGI